MKADLPTWNTTRRKRKRSPAGSAPGTLVSDPEALPTVLSATGLSPEGSRHYAAIGLAEIARLRSEWPVLWVDCTGLRDVDTIAELGRLFDIHRLSLEDVVNVGQRPKAEFHDRVVFVVLDMIDDLVVSRHEQVSVFFGEGFVLTFQERPGDSFDGVRKRLEGEPGRLHAREADYLAYALIDTVVDSYFPVMEAMGDSVERLENDVLGQRNRRQMGRLHDLRRQLLGLKRGLWPLRDAIAALARSDSPLLAGETRVYFTDVLDHCVQLIDLVETYRETMTDLIEMHVSLGQARTGEVIHVLTIVSTIFIPLTFLVGVWGMNFDTSVSPWNMPELEWRYGYPAALGFMAFVALSLVAYFKWRRWF